VEEHTQGSSTENLSRETGIRGQCIGSGIKSREACPLSFTGGLGGEKVPEGKGRKTAMTHLPWVGVFVGGGWGIRDFSSTVYA